MWYFLFVLQCYQYLACVVFQSGRNYYKNIFLEVIEFFILFITPNNKFVLGEMVYYEVGMLYL
jgi:hypothetical protein